MADNNGAKLASPLPNGQTRMKPATPHSPTAPPKK